MNLDSIKTPVYIADESKLRGNLRMLREVMEHTECRILLAQKAFSMFSLYQMISEYLSGATASGLYEARLAHEEMGGEIHVFAPALTDDEMVELCKICDHVSFNSISQLEHHRAAWESKGISVGIRVNPEHSTQEGHEIYDPCAPSSRLGVRKKHFPNKLPKGVEGLHFHTLCEQGAEPLVETFRAFEEKFGEYLTQIKWLNLGGGHHITQKGYNIKLLEELILYIRDKYNLVVYLEPGEAIALNAGYLVTTVLDIVKNDIPVLILDTSAACHMPDVLEMPYRPPLMNSGMPGEKKFTYILASRTCLAGDVVGQYSFDDEIHVGDKLVFEDMAIYSMVKNNTFNGMPLPDIAILRENGNVETVKVFGYKDFKERLS